MGDRPTVAFRLEESQKTEWEQYVEENAEYDSVSDLIRVAVAHEMSDSFGPVGQQNAVDTGALESSMEDVEGEVRDLGRIVESLEETVRKSGTVGTDRVHAVFDALPSRPYEQGKTAVEVAADASLDVGVTHAALNELEQQTGTVTYEVGEDGNRRWSKVGDGL